MQTHLDLINDIPLDPSHHLGKDDLDHGDIRNNSFSEVLRNVFAAIARLFNQIKALLPKRAPADLAPTLQVISSPYAKTVASSMREI